MTTGGDKVVVGEWITTSDAAELADYTLVHVRRLIKAGSVRGKRLGNFWLVNKADLLQWKATAKRGRPRKVAGDE